MERRPIGNTDLMTSPIGFGTWEMSTTMYGSIDVGEASRAVHSAIDHGINLFDTAEVYGPFHSEELLAKALGARRREVILVTKTGFKFDDEKYRVLGRNSRYEHIIARTEGCLRRLNTDVIDLMLIHWPDFETPFDEPVRALQKLKEDGKIRHAGVSNFNIETMDYCRQYTDIAVNQVGYHLFDQRMQRAILPYCLQHNIGFMAYGTLAFGLLTGAFGPDHTFEEADWRRRNYTAFGIPLFQGEHFARELRVAARLAELAAGHGRSLAQLAIAWVLGHPAVSVALVGMRNDRELAENVASTDWRLSDEDRAAIDRIFAEEGCPTYEDYPQSQRF
jgi:aryl-alcohol dehydrogenase-like predicted oxidoreductase